MTPHQPRILGGRYMPRTVAQRYAPFLAVVALIGLLMVVAPQDGTDEGAAGVGGGDEVTAGDQLDGSGDGGGDTDVGSEIGESTGDGGTGGVRTGDVGASGAGTSGGGTRTGSGGSGSGGGGGGATGSGDGREATSTSGQRVDGLGRPIEGDKSKCAPGGLLQESVTSFSLPCIPRFEGDNGGGTHTGVTATEIKIVVFVQHFEPATQAALVAVGLAATDQQFQEASDVYAAFINKHYELYGRKIKPIVYSVDCITGDNACYRAEAKAIVAKHKPFAVTHFVPGIATEAFMDELARQKTIGVGAAGHLTEWFVQRRPYIWTEVAQAPRSVDHVAEYYCKKLWGKNATLAGDPALQVRRRKLGIIVTEDPGDVAVAQHVKKQVSGGMCGSPSDGTQLYTISENSDKADEQRPTLIARMKQDGITTSLQLPSTDVLGCTECDRQRFFPEHIIAGQNQNDADIVGRLDTTAQRRNRFGIGFRPAAAPLNQHDFRKAARDVNPGSEPPYITEGPYQALAMVGRMVQLAGPDLNPVNVERGARSSVQMGGWSNPNPWPGWKCCNPFVPRWQLSGTDNFSAWWDAREVYWDDTAISPDDGQPGAWVCANNCRRYSPGEWPRGEPKR